MKKLQVWDETKSDRQYFFQLYENVRGGIGLHIVDAVGEEYMQGDILTIESSGHIVLCEDIAKNISEFLGLKVDGKGRIRIRGDHEV